MPSGRVAVIIPFYQRDAGILRRAMDSVLAQDLPPDVRVHVFIVDDTSPLPPAQDLDGLTPTDRVTWSVHPQANTGPGGARNRGLDLAEAQGFDWIAFLDSDDSWTPPHLAEALAALDRGYGMYFCDNGREGSHDSYNAQVVALRDQGAAIRAKAREISDDGLTMGFPAGALAAEMIVEYLCQTSAVVLRAAALNGMRFDTEQRRAGEDHLLWINLALDGPALVISWRRNVICGTGVNIFFTSFDWNSPSTMGRIGYKLLFLNKLRQMPRAMRLAETEVMTEWRRYRRAYGFLFIRNLLRGRRPSVEVLGKLMRFDPILPLRMPFLFARIALSRNPAIRDW